MASPKHGLQPRHWKALELIEESMLSLKEISKATKIPLGTLYDLYEGDTKKTGNIGHLFYEVLNKITARNAAKVKHLVKDNKRIAMYKMNEYLRSIADQPANAKMMDKVVKCMNTLNKATPSVSVGSFSVTRGMTPEEMRSEFKRLSALAQFTLDGGGVSRTIAGESGPIPPAAGRGGTVSEE